MDYTSQNFVTKTESQGFQSGFVLTHFLIVFPIVAGLMIFTASLTRILNIEKKLKSEARPQVLKLQDLALDGVSRLQALNPASKLLTVERLQLQLELAAAAASENPIGVAVAIKKLVVNDERKKKLSAAQKLIITSTEAAIQTKLLQHSFQIKRTFRRFSSEIGSQDSATVSHHFSGLAVEPANNSEVAPQYFLKEQYEKEQTVEIKWSYPISAFLPKSIRHFSSNRFTDMTSSTPLKENQKWIAVLKEDKFS